MELRVSFTCGILISVIITGDEGTKGRAGPDASVPPPSCIGKKITVCLQLPIFKADSEFMLVDD